MLSDDDVLAYIGIYNMLFTVPGVYRWFFFKCNFFVKDSLYWQTDFDHSQNPFDVNPCSMALTGRVWGTPFDIVSIPLDFMQSKPSLVYSGISCSFLYLASVSKNIPLSNSARTTILLNYYIKLRCWLFDDTFR